MHACLRLIRPAAWLRSLGLRLALAALMAAATMPTITRLAQPWGLADAAAICQSAASGIPPDAGQAHGELCAYCALAHTTPALPPAPHAAIAAIDFAPPVPVAPDPARAGATQARPPAARGPPSIV
jgi:Protein of unknown function (DUF2946)